MDITIPEPFPKFPNCSLIYCLLGCFYFPKFPLFSLFHIISKNAGDLSPEMQRTPLQFFLFIGCNWLLLVVTTNNNLTAIAADCRRFLI